MATLTYENGKFIYTGRPQERFPAKEAGFRWDPALRHWWTNDKDKALKVAPVAQANKATQEQLKLIAKKVNASLNASRATTADVNVPAPEGLNYLPYQLAGISYALEKDGVLIGDEMGLGKTIQALGVINADTSIRSVLVICPASLRLNWARETEKWLTRPTQITVVTGGKTTDMRITHTPEDPQGEVVIVNYDVLGKHPRLRERTWDLLIVDEAHYLKNNKAQRTQNVLGKWHKEQAKRKNPIRARRRIFMTGTPILNRPSELYTLAKALDHREFGNWMKYHTRYCAAFRNGFGWDVSGASNLQELQDKLRRSFMIRRLKDDVLTELPSKQRQVIELPMNGLSSFVKAEAKAIRAIENRLEALQAKAELAKTSDNEDEYEQVARQLRDESNAAFLEMSRLRHELAVAKVPYVAEFIEEAAAEHPVVVMAHHHDVVDGLSEALSAAGLKVVTLTGRDSMTTRQKAVDAFQEGLADVFIGNIKAAGVGITLTRSSHVIFAELDWTPGNLTQAEDRCHRIGQINSVLVHHLVVDGSLDARMVHSVISKQAVIDQALDNDLPEYELKLNDISPLAKPVSESRDKLLVAGEKLTEDQKAIVLTGLRALAQVCDGAMALDGQGFNGIDSRIGKSLATASSLTSRQAGLGWKILRKYRSQLEAYGVDYQRLYT